MKITNKSFIKVLSLILIFSTVACSTRTKSEYGVYISDTYDELPANVSCDTLAIDAQYYNAKEILKLKESNGTVLSYLNIGSIETFRDYFKDYESLILGKYENWEEEYWINVADKAWQNFIVNDLASALIDKGVDGFFIDNTDVYYNYPSQEIYDGITKILTSLKAKDMLVYINGGDTYVTKYLKENGNLDVVLDGVNQESVFTTIDWDNNTFNENNEETKEYYLEYLSSVASDGKQVFILEYTDDLELTQKIKSKGAELGYKIYVSDSVELD